MDTCDPSSMILSDKGEGDFSFFWDLKRGKEKIEILLELITNSCINSCILDTKYEIAGRIIRIVSVLEQFEWIIQKVCPERNCKIQRFSGGKLLSVQIFRLEKTNKRKEFASYSLFIFKRFREIMRFRRSRDNKFIG